MWEAIGQAIKVFIEKYMIPTVLSVVIAIGSILLLPSDNECIIKIGKLPFGIFVAGLTFLVCMFSVWLFHRVMFIKNRCREKQIIDERREREELKSFKKVWERVDSLSPSERRVICKFLENGNKPIVVEGMSPCFDYEFMELLNTMQVSDGNDGRIKYAYKLDDEIYRDLLFSKEKYGRISNFDEFLQWKTSTHSNTSV